MKNIINKNFFYLTVIKRIESKPYKNGRKKSMCLCKCKCGKYIKVFVDNLFKKNTKSCGCYAIENLRKRSIKHGMSNTHINRIYRSIKKRCNNINDPNYGGRGIKCLWESFEDFYNDMNDTYKENLTIERINNNEHYCKENCKWVDRKVQANNTRRNHIITYNNETHTLKQWSELLNINYKKLHLRIKRYKWPIEKAFID